MTILMDQIVNSNNGFLRRPSILGSGDRMVDRENGLVSDICNSSSSSSIGINSDDDDDDNDDEIQSKLNNNSTFDSVVEDLEQALPIRRGISNFYAGKSKSFASLADTTRSSIKDITKPEDAYSRKRKRILAYNIHYDNARTAMLKSPGIGGGGMSKRSTNSSSRNTLALAVAMNNCEGHENLKESGADANGIKNTRIPSLSPPSPWRSFSLVDLQHCGVSVGSLKSNLCSPLMGKRSKRDEVS